ncbi:hypothetical protein L2735_11965 [Shewanella olleyana]|uniref:hypothetical protein n=1 Tax=Shewanella olleyana TaxID=135626 RepID=UPI00200DC269|nr:hypothetical protein [Shewanella olleyana]MCL1067514.1 hypothetical protein [Shewanella olleyana]
MFFSQAYIWLSLLGGIHCLGVGLYVRYIYANNDSETTQSSRLLGSLFILIALFFATGAITRENAPIQIHFILTLMVPFYFLLMPLLYSYCKSSLKIKVSDLNIIKHLLPTLISMIAIVIAISFNIGLDPDASHQSVNTVSELSHINKLALIAPGFLIAQSLLYSVLIIKTLKKHKKRFKLTNQQSLKDIRFRWLLVLTSGILLNWALRLVMVLVPFYFGDTVSELAHTIARLSLLLTVYGFALYGLHQITRAAYLRGNVKTNISDKPQKASAQLLNSEELNYLQSILNEENATEKRLH